VADDLHLVVRGPERGGLVEEREIFAVGIPANCITSNMCMRRGTKDVRCSGTESAHSFMAESSSATIRCSHSGSEF
jgi:hypothetical protein